MGATGMTTESIPIASLAQIAKAISITEDALDVCKVALEGIVECRDSEQQAQIAFKVLTYISDRQKDVRNVGRKGRVLLG